MMRIIVLFFLCFYSMICTAHTNTSVKTIQFTGLKNIPVSEVLNNIHIHKNHNMTSHEIKDNIRRLFNTGLFKKVQLFNLDNSIIFNFEENPVVSHIIFRGDIQINKHIILKECKSIGIAKHCVLNVNLISKLRHHLKKLYDRTGFYGTKINISYILAKKNYIILRIYIISGTPKTLNNINFTGNKIFSHDQITSLFKSYPNFIQRYIYHNKKYNDVIFQEDLEALKHFYRQNGYIDFRISHLKFISSKDDITINIKIFEGSKYFLSSLMIRGDLKNYDYVFHNELSKVKLNTAYNSYDIYAIKERIENTLLNSGFLQCKIFIHTTIDKINKRINLYFDADLGERFIVNQIKITGHRFTKILPSNDIFKKLAPGSYVNLRLIQQGKYDLEDIGYAKHISVHMKFLPNSLNKVDVIYRLEESDNNDYNFKMGYDAGGINLNIQFRHNNWIGSGVNTIADIVHSKNKNNINFMLSCPSILNNVILSHHIFYTFQNSYGNDFYTSNKMYGLEENIKFIKFKHHIITINAHYNEKEDLCNDSDLAKKNSLNENSKLTGINKIKSNFTISYIWLYNTLPRVDFPHFGKKVFFLGEMVFDNQNKKFHKEYFSFEEYFPIFKHYKFILRTRINSGIECLFDIKNIPYYEGYHIQDAGNIRGFADNSLGPSIIKKQIVQHHGINLGDQPKQYNTMGGNSFLVGKLDLIVPNFFLFNSHYDKLFQTSLFFDVGNIDNIVWQNTVMQFLNKFKNHNFLNNFRAATGVEVVYNSVIGPLHFSYAYPLLHKLKDLLQSLQLNMYHE